MFDIHFSENDDNTKNNQKNKKVSFNEYETYWDPKPEYNKIIPEKKKQISYDDILNSLNMVVINNRLHFIPSNIQNSYKVEENLNDYNNYELEQQNQLPLTKEQIKQRLIANYIYKIRERKRINEAKPRMMFFNGINKQLQINQHTQQYIQKLQNYYKNYQNIPHNYQNNQNKLFKFSQK